MLSSKVACLTALLTFGIVVPVAPAQNPSAEGLYQIISGRYRACCGIAGTDSGYDLPSPYQSFVRFTIDPQTSFATLTFLAADAQTVFGVVPCPVAGPINFTFGYGFTTPIGTVFHVDPGPYYGLAWSYVVSNAASNLRIDGTQGLVQTPCVDLPSQFGHSNVVAVLVQRPALSLLEVSKDGGARVMIRGNPGQTNVIEASANLSLWTPVNTNVMDYSMCPICPYFIFEDAASTNLTHRFYRAYEVH